MEIEDDKRLIFKVLQVRSQKFMPGPHIFISNNNKVPLMAAFICILHCVSMKLTENQLKIANANTLGMIWNILACM